MWRINTMKNIAKELGEVINTFLQNESNCAYIYNPDGSYLQIQPGANFVLIDFKYGEVGK